MHYAGLTRLASEFFIAQRNADFCKSGLPGKPDKIVVIWKMVKQCQAGNYHQVKMAWFPNQ